MSENLQPDTTAVRVALWRAMHILVDPPPHIFRDEIGLKLAEPDSGWQQRPDMHPQGTAAFRASIVARAKFIEDLVEQEAANGLKQYVMLGAGLDTFVQRRPDLAAKLKVFEIDKPETQAWKRQQLLKFGFKISNDLIFVPTNFENGLAWWNQLLKEGFNPKLPALVTSIGVSMYLTKDAIVDTLVQMRQLAPGSKFIMTFMLPLEAVDEADKFGYERSLKGAKASGTPFISFFRPAEMKELAKSVGFRDLHFTSTSILGNTFFAGRSDGLRASTGEEILIAST